MNVKELTLRPTFAAVPFWFGLLSCGSRQIAMLRAEFSAEEAKGRIAVAPMLVRHSPLPEGRIMGDLSKTDRVLAALNLSPESPFS